MNYDRFKKHLEDIRNTVYTEPSFDHHEIITDNLISKINKEEVNDVLDVGFGTGHSLKKFTELGFNVKGITLDSEEYKAAHFLGHDVSIMDMAFLDFEDKSFDFIWCRHSIEHSVMPFIALKEFYRTLRDNGSLYIEVPSDNSIHIENLNHYSMFSDPAWMGLFRKAGFSVSYRNQQHINTFPGNKESIVFMDIYWQYWLNKTHEG